MKMSEIKNLSKLNEKNYRELGEELVGLQVRKQLAKVEKPHLIKSIADRARLATQLTHLKGESSGS